MNITPGIRDRCLELAQKFAYSKSLDEYENYKKELEQLKIPQFKEYFLRNWDDINVNGFQPSRNQLL